MPHSALATAADYAEAMLTARRFKNWLVAILLLMLVTQMTIFLVGHFTDYIFPHTATQPAIAPSHIYDFLQFTVALIDFLGVTLVIVLAIVLALIAIIMLVGRLIGVSRTISAFIWCLVLVVLLFPWQAFLDNTTFSSPDFKVPGALYTWDELKLQVHFEDNPAPQALLKWGRFIVLPGVATIILIIVQARSNRGMKLALGEAIPRTDELR